MLNKFIYLVGILLPFAVVACSSGTVDPNANPFAYTDESSSSISSSSEFHLDDNIYINNPANDGVFVVKQGVQVLEKEELYTITFEKEATTRYVIVDVTVGVAVPTEG